MEINLQKICAITILVGSVFFLIAAFSPVSRVFGEPLAENKLDIIMRSLNQWKVTQFLFVSGAIVTGIGIGLTMPPLVYYIITIVTGVMIYRADPLV